ncbi:uncharacterized protein EV422DRAFT_414330 [Fimicolochytrium jonesii]|uniref:uncharacterized protein n=1 Tax=Fimicolochytrium jonesii TaxID=1396493 RepID=UPI0022FDBFA7|nr:uncharacterized protein EV422DRAFT_414330 [Fimicolochytrium jonesii]KAI8822038.1 hypothetical protein EV422DRAFT_414330 [Fimicolochytrium jonesii]
MLRSDTSVLSASGLLASMASTLMIAQCLRFLVVLLMTAHCLCIPVVTAEVCRLCTTMYNYTSYVFGLIYCSCRTFSDCCIIVIAKAWAEVLSCHLSMGNGNLALSLFWACQIHKLHPAVESFLPNVLVRSCELSPCF